MELGTGIFLSSALIALVLLYGFTKDRWRWRKVVGWTLLVLVILVGGAAAVIAIAQYWQEWFPPQLGRQTHYAGLKLGMTPQEVMYIKGSPPEVLGEENTDPAWRGFLKVIKADKLEKGKKVDDYQHWSYEEYKHSIIVTFNDKRSAVIAILCTSEDKYDRCPSIGTVSDGTSEQVALRRLGSSPEQRIVGVNKTLDFPQLGVKLTLTKEKVNTLEVYDPQANR